MKSSLNFTNRLNMIAEMRNDSVFQILEYDKLDGASDVCTALGLNIIRENGIKLKQVRIMLDDSSVKLENGTLSYMKGKISIKNKIGGVLGLGKKLLANKLTGETIFKPTYYGTGDIFLEPMFNNFALIQLEDDEIIVDNSMFYACESSVDVESEFHDNLSTAFLGGSGIFETRIKGDGIVVLKIPVPETEIFKCVLVNDVLKIDGDFAILRTGNIEVSVEKSSKAIIGSEVNGEGLVHVYRGTGEVWIAPTKNIYNELNFKDVNLFLKKEKNKNDDEM